MSPDDDLAAETDSVSVADYPRRQDSLANSDIDVVGEEEHEQDDQRFNHTTTKLTRPKAKAAGHGPPARKKSRRVVTSDPETDNEYLDVAVDSGHEFEDENEDDYFPADPKPTVKGPTKAKGKALATTSVKGGAERRAKVDNTPEVPATSKKRLPTIKKVKLPYLNTSTSASSTVVIDTAVLPLVGKPIQDGVRKTLNGTIDIDLSNKSIYEEIFSKTVRICY